METVNELIQIDGRIDVFEYLLARVVSQYLWEAMNPHSVRTTGRKNLKSLRGEAETVLAILAMHGHADRDEALRAFAKGVARLTGDEPAVMPESGDWIAAMDAALKKLDALRSNGKETLVRAMIDTVTADQQLVAKELELMRAICASLHVPMPMIADSSGVEQAG